MPLNTDIALTTVATVENALQIDCTTYALEIERAINMYSAMLEGLTGRKLKARVYEDYRLDGKGGHDLFFPHYPVNEVDELLIYDCNNVLYYTVPVADLSKFRVHNNIGKLHLVDNVFLHGEQNIVFTGNCGITDAAELAMLELAVLEMISINNPANTFQASNMKQERLGSYSVTWATPTVNSGSSVSSSPRVQDVINYFSRI